MLEIEFVELPEFQKDLKRLSKKYPSLKDDLELRKTTLTHFPIGRGLDVAQIPELKIKSKIYKARVFCTSLNRESIRLIYCYDEIKSLITLVELYAKSDQKIENRSRIFDNFT